MKKYPYMNKEKFPSNCEEKKSPVNLEDITNAKEKFPINGQIVLSYDERSFEENLPFWETFNMEKEDFYKEVHVSENKDKSNTVGQKVVKYEPIKIVENYI